MTVASLASPSLITGRASRSTVHSPSQHGRSPSPAQVIHWLHRVHRPPGRCRRHRSQHRTLPVPTSGDSCRSTTRRFQNAATLVAAPHFTAYSMRRRRLLHSLQLAATPRQEGGGAGGHGVASMTTRLQRHTASGSGSVVAAEKRTDKKTREGSGGRGLAKRRQRRTITSRDHLPIARDGREEN